MGKTRIVVLGGGYAGVLAAQRIAGRAPAGTQVQLVSDRPHLTERIRLHERVAGGSPRRHALRELVGRLGVGIELGIVEAIDRAKGKVQLRDRSIPFDQLLVALGSRTDWERVPGAADHALSPCDEDAAERMAAHLAQPDPTPLLIIGGGLTAVETASELAEAGFPVRLLTSGPVLPDHAPAARIYAVRVLEALGVQVTEGVRIAAIERDAVHLTGGDVITGRAVWCGGFVPTPIAEDSGLAAGPAGEILVDATLRSRSDPRIFAAGDVARVEGLSHLRMGCATAMPMGAHAADSILAALQGREPEPFRFRFLIRCMSLGRRQGLVQFTDPIDQAVPRFVGGRTGAWMKEQVSRLPVLGLRWEKRLPGLYRWPHPPAAKGATVGEGVLLP